MASASPSVAQPTTVPFSPQRPGDAAAGYRALVSRGWVGCGIPALYYDWAMKLVPSLLPQFETLRDRPTDQDGLPYFLNRFTTKAGVEVLTPNCLMCHAGRINGDLVVGLGNADGVNQVFDGRAPKFAKWVRWGSWLYFWSPSRRHEMAKVGERMAAVAPFIGVGVDGTNPTHNLAWALLMHRNPKDLAWQERPIIADPPPVGPPTDVPPWWWMKKKNAMFAAAGGQGDQTGFMAVNSALCADTVSDFEELFAYFNDIRAYLGSIPPPRYPFAIDATRAAAGRTVFESHCDGCHGTYDPAAPTYPNRLVALASVGTDPALAQYNVVTGTPANELLNASAFTSHGSQYAPFLAYVAPPLDGIWATAPFLHNGSVPTLAALLDSATRPKVWTRSYDSRDYDRDAGGWKFEVLDHGPEDGADPAAGRRIVDTTRAGYGNGGHTFGDALDADDRRDLIEYLKTL